jgi:hypothetical protein
MPLPVEDSIAPAAIERALMIYEWLSERDRAALVQARKALTERIYAMVSAGEVDGQRLIVGGLTYLKTRERESRIVPPHAPRSHARTVRRRGVRGL